MAEKNNVVTAVIIAKNEAARIEMCLKSVSWVSNILVVDNDSEDSTKDIAVRMGARVITVARNDFSQLRTIGKNAVKTEWILYVDADEIVSDDLRKAIIQETQKQDFAGFTIRRKNYFYGNHYWPDDERMLRLMRTKSILEWSGALHETVHIEGLIGDISAPFYHYTHRTLEEMVKKTNDWSETEAKTRYASHHPQMVWWRFLRILMTGFFDTFIRHNGYRAGDVGWIESIYQSFSMFITYAKLWEMQNKHHKK